MVKGHAGRLLPRLGYVVSIGVSVISGAMVQTLDAGRGQVARRGRVIATTPFGMRRGGRPDPSVERGHGCGVDDDPALATSSGAVAAMC